MLNLKKSTLTMTRRLEYLGLILDSVQAKVFQTAVRLSCSRMQVLGLVSTSEAVLHAQFYTRV